MASRRGAPGMTLTVHLALHTPTVTGGDRVRGTLTLNSSKATTLSYAVAQVSGRWTSDRTWVVADAHPSLPGTILDLHPPPYSSPWEASLSDANRAGGGGRSGHAGIIFRSAPLHISAATPLHGTRTYDVDCVLPDALPPTLRGTALRYTYTFIIVVATKSSAPRYLRLPFRVVLPDAHRTAILPVPTPATSGPRPSRFLEAAPGRALSMRTKLVRGPPPPDVETALTLSANGRVTPFGRESDLWRNSAANDEEAPLNFMHHVPPSPRTPLIDGTGADDGDKPDARSKLPASLPMYQISRGGAAVARMYMPKRVHHLGDVLTAVFDFGGAGTACYRVNARLECQEVLRASHALGTKYDAAGTKGIVFRRVYGEHGEFVMSNRNTHVTFSIPHDAPVSFSTDAVDVKWLVHFVFLIPKADAVKATGGVDDNGNDSGRKATVDGDEVDDDVVAPLVADITLEPSASDSEVHGAVVGWEGGAWIGDHPSLWQRLPKAQVDALHWSLPLEVSSRHLSQWGALPEASLVLID